MGGQTQQRDVGERAPLAASASLRRGHQGLTNRDRGGRGGSTQGWGQQRVPAEGVAAGYSPNPVTFRRAARTKNLARFVGGPPATRDPRVAPHPPRREQAHTHHPFLGDIVETGLVGKGNSKEVSVNGGTASHARQAQ